uniref:Polycomb group RING finger protein 1 n=1 Tax=Podarcis muralis TaxID=64176 RepID=A0A670JKA1_PODMU
IYLDGTECWDPSFRASPLEQRGTTWGLLRRGGPSGLPRPLSSRLGREIRVSFGRIRRGSSGAARPPAPSSLAAAAPWWPERELRPAQEGLTRAGRDSPLLSPGRQLQLPACPARSPRRDAGSRCRGDRPRPRPTRKWARRLQDGVSSSGGPHGHRDAAPQPAPGRLQDGPAPQRVCKSCIVKYLQTSKYCPMCSTKIHETQPLLNLKLDRVMQDIVYKLVPGLQESEEKRIREFYQSRGLERVSQPSNEDSASDRVGLPYTTFDHSRAHYYRFDEHVLLCLEKQSSGKEKNKHILQHKYVRCSVRAQVRHLRRVLCCRLELPLQHVQILFNNEVLPDHMTLKQLWLSRWFGKPAPLLLNYSVKEKRR